MSLGSRRAKTIVFIELLVVAVVISFLYTSGFVQFDSSYAVILSAIAVLAAASVSFLLTHFLARQFVDRMFGFDSWSPRRGRPAAAGVTPHEVGRLDLMTDVQLDLLREKHPMDLEISKRISEVYLKRGQTDLFVAERLRLVETGTIGRAQVCAIFQRIADVREREGRLSEAVQYLQQVVIRYPDTVEASNAQRRCEYLEAEDKEKIVSRSGA